jgi:hypothetical protein
VTLFSVLDHRAALTHKTGKMSLHRVFIIAVLILVAFGSCKKEEIAKEKLGPTELFSITFTNSFIQYGYEAVIISDQEGSVLYEGILADWPGGEDHVVELEKTEGQILSLTVVNNNTDIYGVSTSFSNETYYDVANGAVIDMPSSDQYLVTGSPTEAVVKIANVFSLDSVKIMNGRFMTQETQLVEDTLTLRMQRGQWEDLFVKLMVNGEEEMKYFYNQSNQPLFYVDAEDLKSDLETIHIDMPFQSTWSGVVKVATTSDPLPKSVAIYSEYHDSPATEKLTLEVPSALNSYRYEAILFGSACSYRHLSEELPAAFEDYAIEIQEDWIEPARLRFALSSPMDLVTVNYRFKSSDTSSTIGVGSWNVISATNDIDFVFPAISSLINDVIPAFSNEAAPSSAYIEAFEYGVFDHAGYRMFPVSPRRHSFSYKSASTFISF